MFSNTTSSGSLLHSTSVLMTCNPLIPHHMPTKAPLSFLALPAFARKIKPEYTSAKHPCMLVACIVFKRSSFETLCVPSHMPVRLSRRSPCASMSFKYTTCASWCIIMAKHRLFLSEVNPGQWKRDVNMKRLLFPQHVSQP